MNFLPGKLDKQTWQITSECFTYMVQPPLRDQLAGVPNQTRVLLGIRPEDIQVELSPQPEALAATVYISEVLGKETLVTLACGANRIKAVVGAMVRLDIGTPVWMCLAPAGVRIFDAETEALLVDASL
jgi:ABC-type sugar transport system ATPase subunit